MLMKRLITTALFALCGIGLSFAYTPTTWDTESLNSLKNTIIEASNSDLFNYYNQLHTFQKFFHGHDSKLEYYLTNLRDYTYSLFEKQKNRAKVNAKDQKSDLLKQYQASILLTDPLDEYCTWRYNTIDNMSFANDFPTALTIAIWYRESNCGYYLPKNGWGPFQITSKDYGTGEITETIFKQSIQDFFDFAKNKINRYNRSNEEKNHINLTYQNVTFKDLIKFAALYNGLDNGEIKGDILPKSLKYFFEGYDSEFWTGESKRAWIFPQYLKVIDRELQQD